MRLKPGARAEGAVAEEQGFERVLANKYYVDEVYDQTSCKPTWQTRARALARHRRGLIDGLLVNGSALRRVRLDAARGCSPGQVGTYAWVLVIGVLAVLGAFTSADR